MKVRDSGMPEETIWNDFFDPDLLLSGLDIDSRITDLVEIGSGYGTFTIPAAKLISGKLHAFDIDHKMIETLNQKNKKSANNQYTNRAKRYSNPHNRTSRQFDRLRDVIQHITPRVTFGIYKRSIPYFKT